MAATDLERFSVRSGAGWGGRRLRGPRCRRGEERCPALCNGGGTRAARIGAAGCAGLSLLRVRLYELRSPAVPLGERIAVKSLCRVK